jgi:cobalamin synthase
LKAAVGVAISHSLLVAWILTGAASYCATMRPFLLCLSRIYLRSRLVITATKNNHREEGGHRAHGENTPMRPVPLRVLLLSLWAPCSLPPLCGCFLTTTDQSAVDRLASFLVVGRAQRGSAGDFAGDCSSLLAVFLDVRNSITASDRISGVKPDVPTPIDPELLAEFDAAARRPLSLRMRYAFIRVQFSRA